MKKELKIGNVQLENPFLLAPLAGITDAPTRKLCREMGAALVYSEMVSGKGLYYKDKKTDQLLHIDEAEKPVAFQVFSTATAKLLQLTSKAQLILKTTPLKLFFPSLPAKSKT